jgi:hypothetical protein
VVGADLAAVVHHDLLVFPVVDPVEVHRDLLAYQVVAQEVVQ